MNKTKYNFIAVLALVFMANVACKDTKTEQSHGKDNKTEHIQLTHKLGEVSVEKEPKTVVALDYGALENLDQLGVAVAGIPKSHVPDYLNTYNEDSNVADLGTIFEVDYEKLNDLNPDVIFISARMLKNYEELSKIAPTVYIESEQGKELQSVVSNLNLFGEIFNKVEAAERIASNLSADIQKLNDTVKASNKNALILMYNNGKFSAFGKASRFGVIHNLFGFKEAQDGLDTARHGQAVSNEFIQKVNPDYLFIIDRSAVVNKSATNKEAIENVLIKETTAFKNNKIIYLDPEAWYLSGEGATSFGLMVNEVKDNF
ncbi:siderophore ABC transporter substrate-binding protein [Maribacter dokdonensis]|uniref:siderophore ABC transporter substrate-binding protein n=1 Tax=Maribacter dokdonensis TaxID=320912 RepID=UPI002AAF6E22|nr:ABC transporter substrate-binding protein [Maribacter dokdonensis]